MTTRSTYGDFDVSVGPNGKTGSLADEVEIVMLGAGQEVGRSCCVIKYKGATVVCDTGYHPGLSGLPALPYVDELDWSTVDCILVSHFHIDHAASLPYIMEKTNFKDGGGKVYMTSPTKEVYRILMRDFVRLSLNSGGGGGPGDSKLYDESALDASFTSIQAVSFLEEVIVPSRDSALSTTIPNPASGTAAPSIRFTSYPAGHVLGAAMFMIEIAGARILYTGDYSTEEDRHLIPASVPNWGPPPDIMICESTYGVQTLENREEKEARFLQLVRIILKRDGRVLMPVFALGRAQELLLILDEYWTANPDMQRFPIYYVSSLASKCMEVYRNQTSSLNASVQARAAAGDHPFDFQRGRHIRELKDVGRRFEDRGPCVVLASPGFLQSGVSRQLLEKWAPDRRNGLVLTGYSVEGTLARSMQNEPEEFQGLEGRRVRRNCSVDYISFSAHVDYSQNSRFIDEVKPSHLVLVHGESHNVHRLRAALKKTYTEKKADLQIYSPTNTEVLRIKLTRNRIARAIGSLASVPPKDGGSLQGLLVAKDATYTLLAPSDLREFTGLTTSTITNRQRLALEVGWDLVRWHLEGMYGSIEAGVDANRTPVFRVMNAIDVKHVSTHELAVEWHGGTTNDLIADSVLALLLSIDSSPASVKLTTHSHRHPHADVEGAAASPLHVKKEEDEDAMVTNVDTVSRLDRLLAFLSTHFGQVELLSAEQIETEAAAADDDSKPALPNGDVVDAKPEEGEEPKPTLPRPSGPTLRVRVDDRVADISLTDLARGHAVADRADGIQTVRCPHAPLSQRVEAVIDEALEYSLSLADRAPQRQFAHAPSAPVPSTPSVP